MLFPSLLFWSSVSPGEISSPASQLMVADLAGQNQTSLVSGNVALVSGIALDLIKRQVYWADQYQGVIERVDYSGENRQMIRNADVSFFFSPLSNGFFFFIFVFECINFYL